MKPVTEVSTRIIEDIGLPYVSAGLHHGMNALGQRVLVVGAISPPGRHIGVDSRPLPTRPSVRDPNARRSTFLARVQRAGGADDVGARRGSGGCGGACDWRARGAEDRLGRHRAQERHRRRRAEPGRRRRGGRGIPPHHGRGAGERARRWRAGGADAQRRTGTVRRLHARSAMGAGDRGGPRRRLGRGAAGCRRCVRCRSTRPR